MESTFHFDCIPTSKDYQSELEKFKIKIRDNKFDLFANSEKLTKQSLQEYIGILIQLDEISNEVENKIGKIIETREIVGGLFSELSRFTNRLRIFTPMYSMFDFLISEIRQIIFIKMPVTEITWERNIPKLHVSYNPYTFLNHPIWTNGSKGRGPNKFSFPCDLILDPITGTIYIADYQKKEIDVYNKQGGYEMSFKDESLKGPRKLTIKEDFLYVVVETDIILKFNKENGNLVERKKLDFFIGGMDFWEDLLYAGDYHVRRLNVMDRSLNRVNKFQLGLDGLPGIQYVKAREDGVYVLYTNTQKDMLQKFSHTGDFLKVFKEVNSVKEPWFFNIDPDNNIIVTASSSCIVRIYGGNGEVLRSYEKESVDTLGTINLPRGVVITEDYHIKTFKKSPV